MKYIIREVPAEWSDFNSYFDCDGFTEKGGDYCYNLFIIQNEGYGRMYGFNIKEYRRVIEKADAIIDGFNEVRDGVTNYNGDKVTFKDVMLENDIKYNSVMCHKLKEWSENAETNDTDDIAKFLTIITGKHWITSSAHGYSQGDYCEIVYCQEHYMNARIYGEIYLGAGTEYSVITLNDDGEELESVYGFIIADCQATSTERIKALVCEWACIDPNETTLEIIDGYSYHTEHKYIAV